MLGSAPEGAVCFDSDCSSTTTRLCCSQISNLSQSFFMARSALLLLICLFFANQAQWKIFYYAWEGLEPTTAACFHEMSIHTHICVKLAFPAQLMLSVAENWSHMQGAWCYYYMLRSVGWLHWTDGISKTADCCRGKTKQAGISRTWILFLLVSAP